MRAGACASIDIHARMHHRRCRQFIIGRCRHTRQDVSRSEMSPRQPSPPEPRAAGAQRALTVQQMQPSAD
ncbi:hypothetical protein NDU88_004112 [Pleurodeles waltl]|uniref:Uncharacterized protein n=1 Tax=Pleurodeles waltl TaxID=8319 RepID=A0AAV7L0E7_PLEWA|nr:hypothetical protein NDU88_004112 [Pleurodeles waltl]